MFKGTIAAIGARSNSKRIPNKNIKDLGGMHLIGWSINTAKNCNLINKTVLSTDYDFIAEIAYKYNPSIKVINRPPELALDNSTDYEWILHLLKELYKENGYYPKTIVLLRPTTPFRSSDVIEEAIKTFLANNEASSLRSIEPVSEAIEKTFKINEYNYLFPACCGIELKDTNKPNQVFSTTYRANGYVDILNSETILNTNDIYGDKILPFLTKKTIEIDTEEDLQFANFLLKEKRNGKNMSKM